MTEPLRDIEDITASYTSRKELLAVHVQDIMELDKMFQDVERQLIAIKEHDS